MKWIYYFSSCHIPFNIYKLQTGDAIIYQYTSHKYQSIIILQGLLYITKQFTNHEKACIAILQTNNVFDSYNLLLNTQKNDSTYYYKLVALQTTFILSFQLQDLNINKNNINSNLLLNIIASYQNTINKYKIMNNILIHKYMQNRIIQLLLTLSEEFGIIHKHSIIIPFVISQHTISEIVGSNRITVNRILRKLCKNQLISYSYNKYIQINNPLALSHFLFNT
uniref:Global nitrogen transcriptional regulator n=1 Tax=Asparagopsis taxiformis TaxID=260499 RepID=A0A1C9CCE9_9FLOR|nr:global nitrogen transcriptional regulator [Asparagopsis taxiformis]AOM66032.1 global nitrogen transcriptional regulator [Asparagopsis taxiformis]